MARVRLLGLRLARAFPGFLSSCHPQCSMYQAIISYRTSLSLIPSTRKSTPCPPPFLIWPHLPMYVGEKVWSREKSVCMEGRRSFWWEKLLRRKKKPGLDHALVKMWWDEVYHETDYVLSREFSFLWCWRADNKLFSSPPPPTEQWWCRKFTLLRPWLKSPN